MRFIADGPSIPDDLLIARDLGDVIFFCGAGVSQANARLPNFERLGREVIRILGAAQDSPARMLLDIRGSGPALAFCTNSLRTFFVTLDDSRMKRCQGTVLDHPESARL
jgi:hypothetical protein